MRANLRAAFKALAGIPGVTVQAVSSHYLTPPWGVTDQPDFVNAAVRLSVAAGRAAPAPAALLAALKGIERGMGRQRRGRWGPREIDLDILLFGDRAVDEPGLTIPHPRLMQRSFVLIPLAEIAPGLAMLRDPALAPLLADPAVRRLPP